MEWANRWLFRIYFVCFCVCEPLFVRVCESVCLGVEKLIGLKPLKAFRTQQNISSRQDIWPLSSRGKVNLA